MNRPREITVAATVAYIGSATFILAGILLGGSLAVMLYSISQKYPGVDLRKTADPAVPVVEGVIIAAGVALVVLGVLGAITAKGLLRMQPWARRSVIIWCISSTLFCLLGLIYPLLRSEWGIKPTAILLLMLFLFPINAWWLLLFFRPEIRAQFAPPGSRPHTNQLDFREFLAPGRLALAGAGLLFLVFLGWNYRRNSPMREIERSQSAAAAANSWHYRRIRHFGSNPNQKDTIEMDTVCPSYQRSVQTGFDYRGDPVAHEYINFLGDTYDLIGDQWVLEQGPRAEKNRPIFDCLLGALGTDDNSLPYAGILKEGSVRRGAERVVEGTSCRDYEISVPTPYDPKARNFLFAVCINEYDHLPVQAQSRNPGQPVPGVSTFSQFKT